MGVFSEDVAFAHYFMATHPPCKSASGIGKFYADTCFPFQVAIFQIIKIGISKYL